MSAPDNAVHDISMNAEAVVATSLEASSTGGSSDQELALDSEGSPTVARSESGGSADKVNDRRDASNQVPGSALSSSASLAEPSDQASDVASQVAADTDQEQSNQVSAEQHSDGESQATAGTDQEQSNQVNGTTPSAVGM